jgi:hypothetical protein
MSRIVLPRDLYEYYAEYDPIRRYAFDEMIALGLVELEPENKIWTCT